MNGGGWEQPPVTSFPPSTITITDPATTGLTIVPAANQSADVILIAAGNQAVPAATSLNLIHLTSHNTGPATGDLYSIKVETAADIVDTAAGIAVVNTGNADAIYINSQGAAAGTTTPSGIGLDMNRGDSHTYAGYGIQVWDFSTTDIGGPGVGPTGIFLLKKNNPDTNHVMLYIRANRKALRITIPDTTTGGYVATQPVFEVTTNAGADLFAITAAGNVNLANTLGIFLTGTAGNQAYIQLNAANNLLIRGGSATTHFRNNADTADNFQISDAGNVVFRDGATLTLGTVTGVKIGAGATDKLGFYNTTPVVQPATTGTSIGFTAGAGTTVTSLSTFTGNTGATAYTIGDIVNALKKLGLVAA